MSILNRVFPAPIDWQAFERLCCDVYRGIWGDPETQMHGRSGQEQHGVDVYGRQPGVGLVGVQCKGKNGEYRSKPTVAELKREVGKAMGFKPPLNKFILATSAPNEAEVQEAARLLDESHRAQGLFEVHVQGWDTLKHLVAADAQVVRVHYPDLAPYDFVEALRSEVTPQVANVTDMLRAIDAKLNALAAPVERSPSTFQPGSLEARLRDATDLCNEGEPRAALRIAERIRKDSWEAAGPVDRSRIVICAAYCRLAACDDDAALQGFEEAFSIAPDHPGTRATMAVACLLRGDRAAAFDLARQALAADPGCEQAAILLPQAAPADMSLADVEALVPSRFLSIPAALRALAQAASDRGGRGSAIQYAERAYQLAPEDWRSCAQLGAKLLSAVADDDEALALTRMVPPEQRKSFERGVDMLRGAWNMIRENGNARRAPEVAANLCAALLVDGDEKGARSVLDEGLEAAPDDIALLRRLGWFAAVECDWRLALGSFARLRDADLQPEDRFVIAKALLEDGQLERARAAVAELRAIEAGNPGGRQRAAALDLEVELAAGAGEATILAALDGADETIRSAFDKFASVLGAGHGAMVFCYMAEINVGMAGKDGDAGRILDGISFMASKVAASGHHTGSLLYSIGNGYSALGREEEAAKSFEAALDHLVPEDDSDLLAQCYQNLGNSCRISGNEQKAASCFHEALRLRPDLAEARFALARHCHRNGDFFGALEHFDQVVFAGRTLGRRNAVSGWRINVLFNLGEGKAAFREISALLSDAEGEGWIWPWCARQVASFGRASVENAKLSIPFWDRYLTTGLGRPEGVRERFLNKFYLRAEGHGAHLDYRTLKSELEAANLRLDDDDAAFLWDRLGHWAEDDDDSEEAERCFRVAFGLAGGEYGYCLGTALNVLGRAEESLPLLLSQANEIQPDAASWFQLARAYEQTGRISECIDAYRKVVSLDPGHELAWFNMGGVHWNAGERTAASLVWKEAVTRFPGHDLTAFLRRDIPSALH